MNTTTTINHTNNFNIIKVLPSSFKKIKNKFFSAKISTNNKKVSHLSHKEKLKIREDMNRKFLIAHHYSYLSF